jgi:hypothetical protein
MIELHVATEIDATPEAVWDVLTNLPRYRDWNPFIREASGTIGVGHQVCVHPRTSLGLGLVFRPTVIVCEEPHVLRWRGHFLSPQLASGEHTFAIDAIGHGRVRLAQHMIFDGALTTLAAPLILREARRGFEAMNRALAWRVERARPAPARDMHARGP